MDCEVCDGTLMEPDDGEITYWHPLPQEDDTLHEYVPAKMLLNVIDEEPDDCKTPLKVTLHESPDWRPDSVNVTE